MRAAASCGSTALHRRRPEAAAGRIRLADAAFPGLARSGRTIGRGVGASIYPAVENMLLAARALGLGSTPTTRHIGYAKECDDAMGIPPNYHSYAILPIGYPMGRFGPVGRGPLSEIVYLDGWGKPYPGI